MKSCLNCFGHDTSAGVGTIFAIALPVLLTAGLAAMDYSYIITKRNNLQTASDAAVLAAAREFQLLEKEQDSLTSVVQAVLNANLGEKSKDVTFTLDIKEDENEVKITASQDPVALFSGLFSLGLEQISVSATAQVVGSTRICVLGLDEAASETVSLDSNSRLIAKTCAVFSNSKSSQGLSSKSNSVLHAQLICSAGGVVGGTSNFKPDPLTDCPAFEDPLAGRPAPPVGACTENNLEIIDETTTLEPGVYCGGLKIDGNASVQFEPGVYVIKDGPFIVDSNSEIKGEYVGFYLTGLTSTFRFASNATVTLSAPKDGPMAGLLFYEAHGSPELRRHEILSNYARVLVGTMYFPHGRLIIDADTPVADQSAFTAIIAKRVELYSGPNLVLNTDYNATDVPVPEGIKGVGTTVKLTK